MKKRIALLLALAMAFVLCACGPKNPSAGPASNPGTEPSQSGEDNSPAPASGGTIMWLANITSGPQYDAIDAYAASLCAELGYTWKVVYGNAQNDPKGNLDAVKAAMTNDVVAIIFSQDGGVHNIMEEYPDLYAVGLNTDMASVYDEGAPARAVRPMKNSSVRLPTVM